MNYRKQHPSLFKSWDKEFPNNYNRYFRLKVRYAGIPLGPEFKEYRNDRLQKYEENFPEWKYQIIKDIIKEKSKYDK